MILPSFGIISEIIPAFARKPLFGYASMVYAVASIAILSFIVWAHHMFTVGLPAAGLLFFMYATMLIAVPTGVKVFNWLATMWRGSMTFETPMLFAVGFIFLFTMGGFTGLVLAITRSTSSCRTRTTSSRTSTTCWCGVPLRVLRRRVLLAAQVDWHHVQRDARQVALLGVDGVLQHHVLPDALPGPRGHAAAHPDYAQQFADWNMMASIGAFGFGLSQLIFVLALIKCIKGDGAKAPAKRGKARTRSNGRCRPGAVPHVRDAAGRQVGAAGIPWPPT